MNAADGTPIMEDLRVFHGNKHYEVFSSVLGDWDFATAITLDYLIERISRAEQRERVLREALELTPCTCAGDAEHVFECRRCAALATPAPEQPSAPLTVQPQANGVLVEDTTRNLSIIEVEHPLQITCPFDGQQWRFHTQEQVGMFQKHLDWHANGGSK